MSVLHANRKTGPRLTRLEGTQTVKVRGRSKPSFVVQENRVIHLMPRRLRRIDRPQIIYKRPSCGLGLEEADSLRQSTYMKLPCAFTHLMRMELLENINV